MEEARRVRASAVFLATMYVCVAALLIVSGTVSNHKVGWTGGDFTRFTFHSSFALDVFLLLIAGVFGGVSLKRKEAHREIVFNAVGVVVLIVSFISFVVPTSHGTAILLGVLLVPWVQWVMLLSSVLVILTGLGVEGRRNR